jgi:hypothetical protein
VFTGVLLNRRLRERPTLLFVAIIPRTEQIAAEVQQGWLWRKDFIAAVSHGVPDTKNWDAGAPVQVEPYLRLPKVHPHQRCGSSTTSSPWSAP